MRIKGVLAAVLAGVLVSASAANAQSQVEATPYGGSFSTPVSATGAPGYPDLLYVVEREGVVEVVDSGEQLSEPFLDISDEITAGGEKGLLSIAFPDDFEESGLFYAYFTNQTCNEQTGGCDIEVAEFKRRGDDPTDAREGSRRTVITIPHRDAGNHNGGTAMFGPDGKLWLATGDGGGSNDVFNNASRKGKLLGKLLRINPKEPQKKQCRDNGAACPPQLGYRVPGKNPFVGERGKDEIWSVGLRNPYRISFDGDVIAIGDVGQGAREEVDIVPIATAKGADFGWPAREGDIAGPHPDRATGLPLIEPIHTYPRPVEPPDSTFRGVSVTGGIFVRDPRLAGTAFDPANDRYLFGEAFSEPTVRSFVPDIAAQTISDLQSHTFGQPNIATPVGFGEDDANRAYIVTLSGTVYRLDPPMAPRRRN